jgi:uncharacterized protein (DUF2141 family)
MSFRFSFLYILLFSFLLNQTIYADENSPREEKHLPNKGDIEITLSEIPPETKGLIIFIYRSEKNFLKEADEIYQIPLSQLKNKSFILEGITHGEMALSVIADLNGNKELDTKWLGIPAEPVAFAGNHKPKFGPPKYKNHCLVHDSPALSLNIELATP